MPKLKEVIISLTNRCNLRCKMCDIPSKEMEELNTVRWKEIIKDISLLGAQTIVLSGGEPLLREDIFQLIAFAKSNRLNVCLTSNGCLINKEIARRLSKSGVDVVNISIEGTEEVHDSLRGEGTFNKAVLALENLRKYKIESTVAAMVSRHNYKELPYIVELARNYRATTVRFQPFSRIFVNDPLREKDFFIDRKDKKKLREIFEGIIILSAKYGISTNPESYLRMVPSYLSGETIVSKKDCSALWTSCPINAKGDVFSCWVIANGNRQIGSLKEISFFELWNSKRHNYIRESIVKEGCPGCMMSCYDELFGQDGRKKCLLNKAKKIKSISCKRLINKFIQFLRSELAQMKLRYRFYRSYRGSLKNIFNRVSKNPQKRIKAITLDNRDKVEKALEEIGLLKERLRREINKER
ncbi:radical SAM protein [Patescibacteria group bacterium]|nr:radical SAM protein [Patescibacteria group bacterium]